MSSPTLVLTRPRDQAGPWLERLAAVGLPALNLPLLDLAPTVSAADLEAAWGELPACDLVVFVSPGAVDTFFTGPPRVWPTTTLAAAPGPGTADRLLALGVPPSAVVQPAPDSPQFDSEALWTRLASRPWRGSRVLLVRGDGGREWLGDQLRAAGAAVSVFSAYRRTAPEWLEADRALCAAATNSPAAFRWVFTSSEGLSHLPVLAGTEWPRLQSGLQGWATHPRIRQTAQDLGLHAVALVPPDPADWVDRWRAIGADPVPTIRGLSSL